MADALRRRNMQLARLVLAVSLLAPTLTACLDGGVEDELAADDATVGDDDKADLSTGTYTYYFVRPDARRCASPGCGGVFYRLANATQTKCIDGTKAAACYAANLDTEQLALGDVGMAKVYAGMQSGGEVLMRATIAKKDWGNGLGVFAQVNAREAWVAQGPNAATGPVVKLEDAGVRCITFPCPSLRERKLNSSVVAMLAEAGWDAADVADEAIGNALDKMHTDGLIIAGTRYTVTGPGGDGKARTVSQFWLRATDEVEAATTAD